MAPKHTIKLWYFGIRGRGEPIRMLLKLAGVEFEDVRIEMEQWPTLKEETPFGQVPVLEVDGVKIAQSNAIMRYLGREYGFAGATNLEDAQLDMVADLFYDASKAEGITGWPRMLLGAIPFPDGLSKTDYFKQRVSPALDKYAGMFEAFLLEHIADPLWNGDKITWVDVMAAEFFGRFVEYGEPDALEAFPHILQLIARVQALPQIREHIEQRPKTGF